MARFSIRKFKSHTLAITCCLIGLQAATISFNSAQATTVGYWTFEEGIANTSPTIAGSIIDQTANNNDGTPVGNPTYRADVPVSTIPATAASNSLSMEFDGVDDYVSIAQSPSLNSLSNAFTVEFWMKAETLQSSLWLVADQSHGWGDSKGWLFQGDSTGKLGFGVGNDSSFDIISSTADLRDNQWHHVAGTYDSTVSGGLLQLFVDGSLNGTLTSILFASSNRDVNMGASYGGPNGFLRFFNGSVDELRISDVALAPNQFLTASPSAVPIPPALALFGTGLAMMGFIGWRRKRKVAA
ncbi:MAG: LamG domain-containing protein [Hyphomicrobiales bacterium]|nr:LamG domain-containing protein [Hyphomicrobiales bacterium]